MIVGGCSGHSTTDVWSKLAALLGKRLQYERIKDKDQKLRTRNCQENKIVSLEKARAKCVSG